MSAESAATNSCKLRPPKSISSTNSSGLVGRYLMHHAYAEQTIVWDEPVDGFMGAYGAPIYSQEFAETDVSRGCVNGFTFQIGHSRLATDPVDLYRAGHEALLAANVAGATQDGVTN